MLASLLFSSHCGETYTYQTNIIGKRGNSRLLLPKGQGVCGSDATFCNKKETTTKEVGVASFSIIVGMF